MGLNTKMPTGTKKYQYPVPHDSNNCSSTDDAELTIEGTMSGKKRGREHLPPNSDVEQKKQKMEANEEEGKDGEEASDKNGCRVSCTPDPVYASDEEKMKQKLKDQENSTTVNTEHEEKAEGKKCKCHEIGEYLRSIEKRVESVEAEMEKLWADFETLKRETEMRLDWLNGALTVLSAAVGCLMRRFL
ncbi:unnamed protein product [Clonostachys solani]|uniref:Uncharacterized protein n=1 Tax=Clonostachys solani TaxID=160281 RepID=A0A9P0EDK4_9HYPO|nr:unnamed protein product [Clonostachys solani]